MSTPMTQVKICSGVRLDNRYQHTIYFASQEAQRNYFAGKVVRTFPAYSHHRRNWELKVEATVAQAQAWNYLFIENPGVKPYYYFINRVEYVSDTTVKLWLELDVIQTNLFQMSLLPCFVERQHTPGDLIGEHTVPEGLELGTYWNYHVYDMDVISSMGILVLSSLDLFKTFNTETPPVSSYGSIINGVYSGLGVYAFDGWVYLQQKLSTLESLGKLDAIVAIWMYPKNLVEVDTLGGLIAGNEVSWNDFDWNGNQCGYVKKVSILGATLADFYNYQEEIFEGYIPKNRKLYTYPFNLLYATGNQGDKAEYRFEHFEMGAPYTFTVYGAIAPDAGVKLAPTGYSLYGDVTNYDEGITLSNYPPCAWDSDTYKVWLAQNYNQLAHAQDSAMVAGLAGLGTMVAGVATGNLGLAGTGAVGAYHGYNQIQGIMAQKEDAKAQPPQARGTFSSTVNVANGRQTFSFYYKCIRKEYAKQIDDYFTMYGYRLNRVQVPNIHARPAFTFVKTIGCKVTGAMSNEDITLIERIFDNGVTFWKYGDLLGDYDQYNGVNG